MRCPGRLACAGRLAPAPLRLALLGERADALTEVLGGEAGPAQLDQLTLDVRVEFYVSLQHRADHPLIPELGQRGVAGDLNCPFERLLVQTIRLGQPVDETPGPRRACVDAAAHEEQLTRA